MQTRLGSRLYRLAIALAPRVLHYSASFLKVANTFSIRLDLRAVTGFDDC